MICFEGVTHRSGGVAILRDVDRDVETMSRDFLVSREMLAAVETATPID
jgi:hypothetical protein